MSSTHKMNLYQVISVESDSRRSSQPRSASREREKKRRREREREKEKVVGVAFVFVLSVVVWRKSIYINRNIYIFKTCVEHLGKRSVVKRRGRGRGARGEMGLKDASAYWRLAGMSYLKYANLVRYKINVIANGNKIML